MWRNSVARAAALPALGIRAGQEILTVDGERVAQYVADNVAPYQSSSTPQDMAVRSYSYDLLAGDAKQPVRLGLRDASGDTVEIDVARSGYSDIRSWRLTVDSVLPDNIGYLRVDGFEGTR